MAISPDPWARGKRPMVIGKNFRPTGHITELIKILNRWKGNRERLGLPIKNLERTVAYLEEYRDLARQLKRIQYLWCHGRLDILAGELTEEDDCERRDNFG